MSKATSTKLGRMLEASVSDPRNIVRKSAVEAPTQRQAVTFVWDGREITEMASPGQIINKKKAYMRMIRREAEERITQRKLLGY